MKQLQLTDQSLPELEERKSLDRFKLFYEEVPMKQGKSTPSGRLQRPSRTDSK